MLLSDMFEKVLLLCKTNAEEYAYKVFTEEFSTRSTANDSIADVSIINATCTAYSAERIVEHLKLLRSVIYAVSSGDGDGVIISPGSIMYHLLLITALVVFQKLWDSYICSEGLSKFASV